MAVGEMPKGGWLDRLLGVGGYEALLRIRWRTFSVATFLLGLVSDVMQVFGAFAYYFFLLALAVAGVLAFTFLLRLPFRRQCIEPCALALVAVVVFAAVLGLQRLNAAEDRGTLAITVPAVAGLQEALRPVVERLSTVEEKLDALHVKMDQQAAENLRLEATQREILAVSRETLAVLQQEKGIPLAALESQLLRLGADPAIKPADVPAFLERFVAGYLHVRERWTDPGDADASLASARDEAMSLVDAGEISGARRVFRRALEENSALGGRRDIVEASLLADAAWMERLDLHYAAAAALFGQAADLTHFDPKTSWAHRLAQAEALYLEGLEFGDRTALRSAIETYMAALRLAPRNARPDDWSATQNDLGNALLALGEGESNTATLERAVETFESALEERTRERAPLAWAMTQNNLGLALQALGERDSGSWTLERAVEAYSAALGEFTREGTPSDWAMTQNNLGNALRTLGSRERGTANLERAIKAYEAALEVRTRTNDPLAWAATMNNLGNALWAIGSREQGTSTLERALEAYEAALEERTRERVPLDWAMTQNNFALAQHALGLRESGTVTLERAVESFELALAERSRERVPFDWALTMENVALVRFEIGRRREDAEELRAALVAVVGALEEYRAAEAGYYVEKAERLRSDIARALGALRG